MSKRTKPDYCYDSRCPLAETGKGFVLGTGDPESAEMAFIFETPGSEEVQFSLEEDLVRTLIKRQTPRPNFGTVEECRKEIEVRKRDYPDVPLSMLTKGVPGVGPSGVALDMWILPPAGVNRGKVFIDSTLRCLPPKGKQGTYPTKDDRKLAEKCCRHYDRFEKFKPSVLVMTIGPGGLLKEITPLPLIIEDLKRAMDYFRGGERVVILFGGKAAKAFARYGENITKFRGSYRILPERWSEIYKSAFEFTAKGKRKKKLKKGEIEERFKNTEEMFATAEIEAPKRKSGVRRKRVSKAEEIPAAFQQGEHAKGELAGVDSALLGVVSSG